MRKLSNYSSDDFETIFDKFFENVLPVAPKKFPRMSEEIKKKIPEQSPWTFRGTLNK